MDEAASGGWNASKKRKRFLIAIVTEGYVSNKKYASSLARITHDGKTAAAFYHPKPEKAQPRCAGSFTRGWVLERALGDFVYRRAARGGSTGRRCCSGWLTVLTR